MKNSDKYYTPEIEEFHVGFVYELAGINELPEGFYWNKWVFGQDDAPYELDEEGWAKNIENRIIQNAIRVKYLDREDIESLGWEENGNIIIQDTTDIALSWVIYIDETEYKEKYYQMHIYKGLLYISYIEYRNSVGSTEEQLFRGAIKNKSELKRLLIQLGIL